MACATLAREGLSVVVLDQLAVTPDGGESDKAKAFLLLYERLGMVGGTSG